MHPEDEYSNDEVKRRYKYYFGDDNKRVLTGRSLIPGRSGKTCPSLLRRSSKDFRGFTTGVTIEMASSGPSDSKA